MGGEPDQDYFSDGITEDIITDLSLVSGLQVIARHSTLVYKGRAVSISDVGDDLGVSYVLAGSVRRAGDRLRITAQLIDWAAPASYSSIWASAGVPRYGRARTVATRPPPRRRATRYGKAASVPAPEPPWASWRAFTGR